MWQSISKLPIIALAIAGTAGTEGKFSNVIGIITGSKIRK
jgi:hypothetical protein